MADYIFTVGSAGMARGEIDLVDDTIRVLALTSTTGIDIDDDTLATVLAAAAEVTGGSYARQTLGSKTVTQDDTNNKTVFDAADFTFPGVATGQDIVALIYYKFITDDASSIPLFYIDSATGLPLTANDGNVTVTIPSTGIMSIATA